MLEAVSQRGSLNSVAVQALSSFDSATVALATLGSETGANGFWLADTLFRLRFNFRTLLVISFALESSSFWTGLGFSVAF